MRHISRRPTPGFSSWVANSVRNLIIAERMRVFTVPSGASNFAAISDCGNREAGHRRSARGEQRYTLHLAYFEGLTLGARQRLATSAAQDQPEEASDALKETFRSEQRGAGGRWRGSE